jgi:hypothetical protein
VIQSLIVPGTLINQCHNRCLAGKDGTFQEQQLHRHRMQMPYCKKWIFQVVEQSKTEYDIESSKLAQAWILCIALLEPHLRKAPLCFLHILPTAIHGKNLEAERMQQAREIAQSTAHVDRCPQSQLIFELLHYLTNDRGA